MDGGRLEWGVTVVRVKKKQLREGWDKRGGEKRAEKRPN